MCNAKFAKSTYQALRGISLVAARPENCSRLTGRMIYMYHGRSWPVEHIVPERVYRGSRWELISKEMISDGQYIHR
jgi:hypothetical protein